MTESNQALDVEEFIDEAPFGVFHFLIVFLCGLVMIIDGYDLISMGMVLPRISADWGLEPQAFGAGLLSPLSGTLFGVLFGSAIAGFLADQIGRRLTLIIMLIVAAVFMALTPNAQSLTELTLYRIATGIGAGGSIPITIALTSEYAPRKLRNVLVVIMYSGASLGTVLGAYLAPTVMNTYQEYAGGADQTTGWEGMFYFGALLPILICVLLLTLLPESAKFLVSKNAPPEKIRNLLNRVKKQDLSQVTRFFSPEPPESNNSIAAIFSNGLAGITLLLWFIFFAMQFVIFLVSLFLPTVYTLAGQPETIAQTALGNYNLGGFFIGVLMGVAADRIGGLKTLLICLPISAVSLVVLGLLGNSPEIFILFAFIAGGFTIGAQFCLGPLAASFYKTASRSTGVGSALGIGRAGSIIAPMAGAQLIALKADVSTFFFVAALSPALATVGIVLLIALTRKSSR